MDMDVSDQFLKFAAECELMATLTTSRASKRDWHSMAERWIRCAKSIERRSAPNTAGPMRRHRKSKRRWSHLGSAVP